MVVVFGDNLRRQRVAVATYIIAFVCVVVATLAAMAPDAEIEIVRALAFVPLDFSRHPATAMYTLLTAEFVHSGPEHLVGNLIFLIAFGRSIENLVGPVVFA